MKIGIIREEKNPPDNRAPLTPLQCADLHDLFPEIELAIEPSATRCFSNEEYIKAGVPLQKELSDCDVLLGIKEVPLEKLIPNKTYFFFSHTIKEQPYNKSLMQTLIAKKIRMIDYETLTYVDGKRILGFGFFAGVVGAHNGLLTYGKKFDIFNLKPAHSCKDIEEMEAQYRQITLPPIQIVLTGSGRVSHGLLNVMEHWDIESVEPQDFLAYQYDYPVYTLLKGWDLYENMETHKYNRDEFHQYPERYKCKFLPYTHQADILMNGIYWDEDIQPLFAKENVLTADFKLSVIADITCDIEGSVPINFAATTIAEPVYGVDKNTLRRTAPYQNTKKIIDLMTVDNLPNELPHDASKHFGEHLIKFILPELLKEQSDILDRGTICRNGQLTASYAYLKSYAFD